MSKQASGRAFIQMGGAFAVAALILAGASTPCLALESKTVTDGLTACVEWCIKNNKTPAAQNKCSDNCKKYWYCNGSDASRWTTQCSQARAGSATITTNPQTTPQSPAKTNPTGTFTTP